MNDIVHCRSEFRFAEKPVSFRFYGGSYKISRVLVESRCEDGYEFIVCTEQNDFFRLHFDEQLDFWTIKPIKRIKETS